MTTVELIQQALEKLTDDELEATGSQGTFQELRKTELKKRFDRRFP